MHESRLAFRSPKCWVFIGIHTTRSVTSFRALFPHSPREILIRGEYVRGRKMLAFIVVCIVLAISAAYELIEWGAALALGQGADEFLGTQGDPWDTQSDMFFAFMGSVIALLLLSGSQDRQIHRLQSREAT